MFAMRNRIQRNPNRSVDRPQRLGTGAYGAGTGLGAGDINGDGKARYPRDPNGWWEQTCARKRSNVHGSIIRWIRRPQRVGGAIMAVYDVNGDGFERCRDLTPMRTAGGFGVV